MSGQRLEATRWPGVYRRGARYAHEWTAADGKRRRGSADTATAGSRGEGPAEAPLLTEHEREAGR